MEGCTISPVPDDHHRVTVDLHEGTWNKLNQRLDEINASRPDYQGKLTKAGLLRGLVGSFVKGELPSTRRHNKRRGGHDLGP